MKTIKICSFLIVLLAAVNGCKKDSSINSTPQNGNRITANYKYNDVTSLANPENKTNGLILEAIISDDVDEMGSSEKWNYSYSSGGIAVTYYYHATKVHVMQDSISTMVKLPPTQLISNEWIDSKDVLQIAENHGGREFRAKNNDNKIELKLEEPLGYNQATYWYVNYYSQKDRTNKLEFIINATTGTIQK